MTTQQKIEIAARFEVRGIPSTSLTMMCRKAKISLPKLHKFLYGQTMGVVGGVAMVYLPDIERFIKGLPNND